MLSNSIHVDFKPVFCESKVSWFAIYHNIIHFKCGLSVQTFSGHGMFKQEACDLSFTKGSALTHWHISDVTGNLYVFQEKTLQNVPVKWTEWQQGCQRVDEGMCSYPSSVTIISLMPPSWTPDRSVIWWAAGIPFSDAFTTCQEMLCAFQLLHCA